MPSPSMLYRAYREVLDEKIPYPVLQISDGTTMTYPRFFIKILEEKGFICSHRFEGVASDASVDMYVENPSGSGVYMYIIAVEIASYGQGWIDFYRNNSISTSGTRANIFPLFLGSAKTSKIYIEYGGTYTLGDLAMYTITPGGRRSRAIGSLAEVGETLIIPPGQNMVIRFTNKSDTTVDVSIKIIWWEDPATQQG